MKQPEVRCDCGLLLHKGSCDVALAVHFAKNITRVKIQDGTEPVKPPVRGRI